MLYYFKKETECCFFMCLFKEEKPKNIDYKIIVVIKRYVFPL